jgi:hypothetical protein
MSVAPWQVFKISPIMLDAGGSEPTTLQHVQQAVKSNTVIFNGAGDWTAANAPAGTGSPSQLLASGARKSFRVACPTDGTLFYIGVDSTLTPATGVAIAPGTALQVLGWVGPVTTLSSIGAPSGFFYQTT